MYPNDCVGMILAGGKGERLGSLTEKVAKPAVHFGGGYRIIDYTLSNCRHSGIDRIGVLTQYCHTDLHRYLGDGRTWNLNISDGWVQALSSQAKRLQYTGTANAIYENMDFIEACNPEHVLILSGDHIYRMDYSEMLEFHKRADADITIASTPVRKSDASRFGILSAARNGRVSEFEEKPPIPKSNLASMGIYIFKWESLKRYLIADGYDKRSQHDFGRDIIPKALETGEKLYTFKFHGYWKDVGTIKSLWESNMDLLLEMPMQEKGSKWEIYSNTNLRKPRYILDNGRVKNSIISEGCAIYGTVENSILCERAKVSVGAKIKDSVLMPGAFVGQDTVVQRAIIGNGAVIGNRSEIGSKDGYDGFVDDRICSDGISLIGPDAFISGNINISKNSHLGNGWLLFREYQRGTQMPKYREPTNMQI